MGRGKRKKEEGKGDGGRATVMGLVVVVAIVAGIVGLYSMSRGGSEMEMPPPDAPGNLPDYAYTSAASLRAYTVALRIPDVLEQSEVDRLLGLVGVRFSFMLGEKSGDGVAFFKAEDVFGGVLCPEMEEGPALLV